MAPFNGDEFTKAMHDSGACVYFYNPKWYSNKFQSRTWKRIERVDRIMMRRMTKPNWLASKVRPWSTTVLFEGKSKNTRCSRTR